MPDQDKTATGENLEGKPRFTEDEVDVARAVAILFGECATICRGEAGLLYVRVPPANYHIPIKLFQSLRPSQSITLEEIIGDR